MGTTQIDSHYRLPIAYTFIIGKAHLPTCASVQFGHQVFFARLPCNGRKLLDYAICVVVITESVNSGNVHVFVTAHDRTVCADLIRKPVLMKHMPREKQVVVFAPVMIRFHKILYEKFRKQFCILPFDFCVIFPVFS